MHKGHPCTVWSLSHDIGILSGFPIICIFGLPPLWVLTLFAATFFPTVLGNMPLFATIEAFGISSVAFLFCMKSGIGGLLFRRSWLEFTQVIEFNHICTDVVCSER